MFTKIAAVALLMTATPVFAATPALDRREASQRDRIAQGVASGELTRPEAHRLVRGERRLDRHEAVAKSTGDRVTPLERARLQRDANRMSRRIYRQKNDLQVRK